LDVEGEGRRPTRAHVLKLGKRHGFSERRSAEIVDQTRAAVSGWPKFAKASGVSTGSAKLIGEAHARVWADFEFP
jgi:serine/threonine-protein kinase HipA